MSFWLILHMPYVKMCNIDFYFCHTTAYYDVGVHFCSFHRSLLFRSLRFTWLVLSKKSLFKYFMFPCLFLDPQLCPYEKINLLLSSQEHFLGHLKYPLMSFFLCLLFLYFYFDAHPPPPFFIHAIVISNTTASEVFSVLSY